MLRVLSTLHRPGYLWLGAPHLDTLPPDGTRDRFDETGRDTPHPGSAAQVLRTTGTVYDPPSIAGG